MSTLKEGVTAAARWLETRLRRLFFLAVTGFALYVLGRAVAGDWGEAVAAMSLVVLGMLLAGVFLLGGVLFGVALLERLRQGRPVVGALPDVVQAATMSGKIARGEPLEEPAPPPFLPGQHDEEQERIEAETRALYERAMQMVERMAGQGVEGDGANG